MSQESCGGGRETTPTYIRLHEWYKGRTSKSTAFRWINAGLVTTVKFGRQVYVTETFDQFINRVSVPREPGPIPPSHQKRAAARAEKAGTSSADAA